MRDAARSNACMGSDASCSAIWSTRSKESRASYVRDLLCLDPQWVVRWEDDESYLDTFGEFLDTFPNGDPRMQIRLADSYESSTTYTGRIWIYRVTTDRAYAASLERGACVPPRK